MSRTARDVEPIEIELMRGGDVVSTLTGAFGQSLQETRLTAMDLQTLVWTRGVASPWRDWKAA
jgi:hypothetical protein